MKRKLDCALFDVDGVLVDIRHSYNEAIKKAAAEFLIRFYHGGKKDAGLRLSHRTVKEIATDRLIVKFRQSGGFNNDADTCYAITLALMAKPPASVKEGKAFLFKVAENADESGIQSVEEYLKGESIEIEGYKGMLCYPAPVSESPLARLFDEIFYGPKLFEKQNGVKPKFITGKSRPMIENDKIAVSARTLKTLAEYFQQKLAMVTGRSRLATEYSLGKLMRYFNVDACVFLEDEKREYAKPNPYAINRAMQKMDAPSAVYAGDSTEDLLMARRADAGSQITFVGIYGFSATPRETLRAFKRAGIEHVEKSVNSLSRIVGRLGA